ncbi:MAG: S41 family peptidase, partial [Rhizomicrobium sp.]
DDRRITGRALDGADILSCDGHPIGQVAQSILPFHAVMSDEAEQVLRAGWLLIDDGNPFVHRPAACVFDRAGTRMDITLHWTRIGLYKLVKSDWPHPFGQAGFGVRRSGKGYWISIQALTPKAQPVLNAVKAQLTQIRAAPYVVVDLRGNGGGDDNYGRRLAQELYGTGYVDAILGPGVFAASSCNEVYRASPQNIAALTQAAQVFRRTGDAIGAKAYHDAVARMTAARAHGQALTGPLTCPRAPTAQHATARPRFKGKVFVLTDAACFSSCINVVGFFRKLGAMQVGEDTGSDSHYAEVRQIVLPSGLSTFSTLQAIMPDYPRKIGPFVPRRIYDGNIADTSALQAWIRRLAARP